jgi:hypothetical protein
LPSFLKMSFCNFIIETNIFATLSKTSLASITALYLRRIQIKKEYHYGYDF